MYFPRVFCSDSAASLMEDLGSLEGDAVLWLSLWSRGADFEAMMLKTT